MFGTETKRKLYPFCLKIMTQIVYPFKEIVSKPLPHIKRMAQILSKKS